MYCVASSLVKAINKIVKVKNGLFSTADIPDQHQME